MTVQESEPQLPGSGELVKLITAGRLTGLPHIVTVRYVRAGGDYYVLAGRARSDWALNALSRGTAKVRFGEWK